MAKTAKIELVFTTYRDGELLDEEIITGDVSPVIEYTKLTNKKNAVASGSPQTIDLSEIDPHKAFILINRGDANIDYELSGKGSSSGLISPGGFLSMANGNIDAVIISTGNTSPVDYEYFLIG